MDYFDFFDIESFDHYIYEYCDQNDIKGIEEEKGIQSMFSFGASSLSNNQIKGLNDFELISFLVIK